MTIPVQGYAYADAGVRIQVKGGLLLAATEISWSESVDDGELRIVGVSYAVQATEGDYKAEANMTLTLESWTEYSNYLCSISPGGKSYARVPHIITVSATPGPGQRLPVKNAMLKVFGVTKQERGAKGSGNDAQTVKVDLHVQMIKDDGRTMVQNVNGFLLQ